MDLAEIAGGAELIVLGKLLLAEHHEDVLVEGVPDRLHGGIVERLPQIEPGDLGAERLGQWRDLHGVLSFLFLDYVFCPLLSTSRSA